MAKKAIQNRNQIADALSLAADRAADASLRNALRELSRELMRDREETSSERVDAELLEIARSMSEYAGAGLTTNVDNGIARMRTLIAARHTMDERSGKRMGLLGKLKQTLRGKKEEPSADSALQSTDANLYKLEQAIETISQKRQAKVNELKALVQSAAQYAPDSYEYKQARARAGSTKQQIKLYESQIDTHFKALMNNQRYAQLIENGLAMKNLEALLPDSAEADTILDQLSETVEKVSDAQGLLDDVIAKHEKRGLHAQETLDTDDADFDRDVAAYAAAHAEAAAPAEAAPIPEPEAPQPEAAEAAPVTAEPEKMMEEDVLDGNS